MPYPSRAQQLDAIHEELATTNRLLGQIVNLLTEANEPQPMPQYTINNPVSCMEPVVLRQAAAWVASS